MNHVNNALGVVLTAIVAVSGLNGQTSGGGTSGGGGGGASATVENVFTGAGTSNFTHSLGTPNPVTTCYAKSGATTYALAEVDNNNIAVTVPGASDLICAFVYAPAPPSDFSFALSGIPGLFVPALSAIETVPVTVTQSAINGFTASTNYSLSGLPSGLSGSFSPNPITGGSGTSTLTMNFPYNQASGGNGFTVTGTGGSKTHSQNPSIPIATTNNGLVEGWPANEGSGSTIHTITSSGDDAAATAVTWTTPAGFTVPVAIYNGSTSTAHGANNTNTNFDGTAPFSICSWTSFANLGGGVTETIASTLNIASAPAYVGYEFSKNTLNQLELLLVANLGAGNYIDVDQNSSSTLIAGANLVCSTYDGSRTAAGVKLYANGSPVASLSTLHDGLTTSMANTIPVYMGARTDLTNVHNGGLGFVRFYNRVLTSGEISTLFTAGPK